MNRLQRRQKLGQGERSVLQVALDVHTTTMGSSERPKADQVRDIKLLRYIIKSWEPTLLDKSRQFDRTVYNVIRVALIEAGEPWFPVQSPFDS